MKIIIFLTLVLSLNVNAKEKKKIEAKRLYSEAAYSTSFLLNNWNKYKENYHPNYILDDDDTTAWVEGAQGNGEGESISWNISELKSANKIILKIRNGYQKNQKLFKANAVPKNVTIEILNKGGQVLVTKKLDLKKKWGWQEVNLNTKGKKRLAKIKLTVNSVYPGKVYKDTCISDIQTFVESDVLYDKKAELGKHSVLKNWIKGRLKKAKYFANIPVKYPFAATNFHETLPMRDSEYNLGVYELPESKKNQSLANQMKFPERRTEKFKKFISESNLKKVNNYLQLIKLTSKKGSWYKPTKMNNGDVKLPDFSGNNTSVVEGVLNDVLDYLVLANTSFFETDKAVGNKTEIRGDYMASLYSNPKVIKVDNKITGIYFWKKEAWQERGLSVYVYHYYLAVKDNKIQEIFKATFGGNINDDTKNTIMDTAKSIDLGFGSRDITGFTLLEFKPVKNKIDEIHRLQVYFDEVDNGYLSYNSGRLKAFKKEVSKSK